MSLQPTSGGALCPLRVQAAAAGT